MKTTSLNSLRNFLKDSAGNATMIFGLSAIPLFFAAGATVEYLNMSKARTEMQAAVDAAALAAANTYAVGGTTYEATAKNYINKNLPKALKSGTLNVTTKVDKVQNLIKVTATGNVVSAFGDILNLGSGSDNASEVQSNTPSKIGATATVSLPVFSDFHKGEIAMVVDFSWSMYDKVDGVRKYVSMREAAVKLIDDLTQKGVNNDVKFGLVPFSESVRVTMPKYYIDGQSSSSNGTYCIEDRKYPYNREATTPSTTNNNNNKTRWGQSTSATCSDYQKYSVNVKPLTTDHASTKAQLNTMYPIGNTHIALGLEMAYHLLTPNAPYTEGVAMNTADTLKAVILLTDGAQTSPGYGANNKWTVAAAEANTAALCTALKTAKVRVVTVSFDLDDVADAASEKRLQDCASGPEYYFNTDNNTELAAAFGVIKNQLAKVMYLAE
ncbi:MAG: pilus assembly protein TadG-related protein [Hyphomicrobiales bacterium]